MSHRGVSTTTTYFEWEKAAYLIKLAQKNNKHKIAIIKAVGIYSDMRISDIWLLEYGTLSLK